LGVAFVFRTLQEMDYALYALVGMVEP